MLGFRLFLHALKMVLGNLGAAIRITVPILIFFTLFFVLSYAMFGSVNYTANWTQGAGWVGPAGAPPAGYVAFVFLAFLGGVIAFLWTATAWHRFILLEEMPGALGPVLNTAAIGRYLLRLIVLGIILVVLFLFVGMIGALLVAIVATGLPPSMVAAFLGLLIYLPVVVIAYRLSPVLPAAATGAQLTLGAAWEATRGASGALIMLAVLTVVAGWALQQPIVVLSGPAPILAALVAIVVQWISSMFGISILTTIYGHFIEKRELNV